MSANFTPEMGAYKHIGPFRFWCQKVLPSVYDDSLSYYELLNKVVVYLNNMIENNNTTNNNVELLYVAYEELQRYVNNYFDELDVQQAINDKLDKMAVDGSLNDVVEPLLENIVKAQNQAIAVLEGRMDTFSALPAGSTAGDAELADIRVGYDGTNYPTAGDAVRGQVGDLHLDVNTLNNFKGFVWNIGNGIDSNGNLDVTITQAVTDKVPCAEGDMVISKTVTSDATGISLSKIIYLYKGDTYLGRNFLGYNTPFYIPATADYFRILFGRPSSSNVPSTAEDINQYAKFIVVTKGASSAQLRDFEKAHDYDIVWTERKGVFVGNYGVGEVINLANATLGAPAYKYAVVKCYGGEKFAITTLGGGGPRAYGWLDSNNVLLGMAGDAARLNNELVVAPANAATLVVNCSMLDYGRIVRLDAPIGKFLERLVVYENIEEMVSFFKSEDKYCYVVNDNSEYCQNYGGNYYQYSDLMKYGEIGLDNGGYAHLVIPKFTPIKGNDGCVDYIVSIGESYMGVGVQYMSVNGPFYNEAGHWGGIQCSQFANAILQGLMYNKSRLYTKALTENEMIDGGCKWMDIPAFTNSVDGCLDTNGLAHFAACHGWLSVANTTKNVQAGDVVFFNGKGKYPGSESAYDEVQWKGINHAAICVARVGKKTLLIEAGSIPDIDGLTNTDSYRVDANDAVHYSVILDDETPVTGGTASMFGFARFPLYYRDRTVVEQGVIAKALGG